jgi:tRNA threonylcarbamoyl adenosine modification protein YjeE
MEDIISKSKLNDYTKKIIESFLKTNNNAIIFEGQLGAGKTTFIKSFIKNLENNKVLVTSPTFNIINIYELQNFKIMHLDLYRLKNLEELIELDVFHHYNNHDNNLDNISIKNKRSIFLIEWPDKFITYLQKHLRISNMKITTLSQTKRKYLFSI